MTDDQYLYDTVFFFCLRQFQEMRLNWSVNITVNYPSLLFLHGPRQSIGDIKCYKSSRKKIIVS